MMVLESQNQCLKVCSVLRICPRVCALKRKLRNKLSARTKPPISLIYASVKVSQLKQHFFPFPPYLLMGTSFNYYRTSVLPIILKRFFFFFSYLPYITSLQLMITYKPILNKGQNLMSTGVSIAAENETKTWDILMLQTSNHS